jgi:ketosteroid isomerase-like protein
MATVNAMRLSCYAPGLCGKGKEMNRGFRVALFAWLAACWLCLPVGTASAGQHKQKEKTLDTNVENAAATSLLPAQQVIDAEISDMLGAWQAGDVDKLRSFYAADVTVVSGAYEPPIMGWANYLAAYQRQRQRIGALRLDRRHTIIVVKGDMAWVAYQWEFTAEVDRRPTSARGHTSLILAHQGDRWLIVHNHTSEVCEPTPAPATQPPAAKPGL